MSGFTSSPCLFDQLRRLLLRPSSTQPAKAGLLAVLCVMSRPCLSCELTCLAQGTLVQNTYRIQPGAAVQQKDGEHSSSSIFDQFLVETMR